MTTDQTIGVSTVLAGDDTLSDAVIECADLGISILPAGPAPQNSNEMIQSTAMYNMISELEKNYDYILFDTPPVSDSVDALTLSPFTDGVLFVVRQRYTPIEKALKSKSSLEIIRANVLGCIMNACDNSI
ncbi:putative tyrosine-protein kinase YveL [bioreactor metagenome]|uniref:Putative tyrosine-protein kinase YveL n=1 Tax=bioreactor metagenome TaxID=1076179 RepID=A0A645HMT8_9ZZZZ